ncbi:hypothetical protein M422DRAFT_63091 [Sphaerobolus stellatus SS14]|nr:hypothetical protein M422DRAFT_63091 [Sphaerobolus stellatus SS14]
MYKLAFFTVALVSLTCVMGGPAVLVTRNGTAFAVPNSDDFPSCKSSCSDLRSLLNGCSPGIGACVCDAKVPAAAQSCWDCLGQQKGVTDGFRTAINEVAADFNGYCKSQNLAYATPVRNVSLANTGNNSTIPNSADKMQAFGLVRLVVPGVMALSTLASLI